MAHRRVVAAGVNYTITDDDPARGDLLPWAVLRTRAIDELTLAPPIAPVALTSTLAGSHSRSADGGVCGLVGRPRDVAQALVTPNSFAAQVAAPGYLARDLTPAIEAARRTLNAIAVIGTSTLSVVPPDPARTQFDTGRGVLIDTPPPTVRQDFTTVAPTAAPPLPGDVPLATPTTAPLRPFGTHIAGVPLALDDQPLHRDTPLRIRGRLRARTGPITIIPAIGASLGILGIWWDYPSCVTSPPLAPDVCAVEPTLRLSHPVGATVHSCTLNPIGAARTLVAAADLESLAIVVAPNGGLNPAGGDLIRIGDPLSEENEAIVTGGFVAPLDPAAAVQLRLRTPTGYIHRRAETVQTMQAVAVAPVSNIVREALAGDAVLFAPGLTALPTSSVLIVEQGTPRAVFYRATQLPFTPNGVVFNHQIPLDPTGGFAWPPIARVAQIRVVAALAPFTTVQRDIALDYGGEVTIAIDLQ